VFYPNIDGAIRMQELVPGWTMEVERGPDWIFVRLHASDEPRSHDFPLAEGLWSLLRQHFSSRMVLEMEDVPRLGSVLIGQLVQLHKRVNTSGGIVRLSGLSDGNQQALAASRLDERFPQFGCRDDAIRGEAPRNPR
jgi:hypothetical protein